MKRLIIKEYEDKIPLTKDEIFELSQLIQKEMGTDYKELKSIFIGLDDELNRVIIFKGIEDTTVVDMEIGE